MTLRYGSWLRSACEIRRYARLDQRQQPTVDCADEVISADLARGEGLLDMRCETLAERTAGIEMLSSVRRLRAGCVAAPIGAGARR
jgi:hypothetical protein